MSTRRLPAFLAAAFLLLAAAPAAHADPVILRMASLAPKGTAWMNLFEKWARNIESRTSGRVKVKMYAGGVAGDERDVLRKMKLGQLSGAAVTGTGLAAIDLEVRTVEVARTYQELDTLRLKLAGVLKKRFDDRGYVLLGWGDVGPVRLFSQKEIKSFEDLQSLKLWLWNDDPVSKKMFAALGIRGVPMGVPDVLPALSTGSVDSFFGSPLSTLALQWATHTKYCTSMVMMQATGATVMTKAEFNKLTPEDQKILLDESAAMEKDVMKQVRDDNEKALEQMQRKYGLIVSQTPPEFAKELRRRGEAIAVEIGKGFSPETRQQIQGILDEYQAHQK